MEYIGTARTIAVLLDRFEHSGMSEIQSISRLVSKFNSSLPRRIIRIALHPITLTIPRYQLAKPSTKLFAIKHNLDYAVLSFPTIPLSPVPAPWFRRRFIAFKTSKAVALASTFRLAQPADLEDLQSEVRKDGSYGRPPMIYQIARTITRYGWRLYEVSKRTSEFVAVSLFHARDFWRYRTIHGWRPHQADDGASIAGKIFLSSTTVLLHV